MKIQTTRALRDGKLCQGQKLIRDSNPDLWSKPDPHPDACRMGPKMLWMHYPNGIESLRQVSYELTADCFRNASKSSKIPYSTTVRKMNKNNQ